MRSGRKVKMMKLQLLALELLDTMDAPERLKQRDVTDLYYDDKDWILRNGGLINIQLNGLPGSGKSTVMTAEVIDTNERLEKETTIDHILPNQIVYNEVMRQLSGQMHECIGVDEYDVLGETGYNSSVDKSQLAHFSDLHRDDYVHKYACSPQDLLDKNCFLILEVLQADKKQGFTRCLVFYRLMQAGREHMQLVGYVDIDVRRAIASKMYKEYYKRKQHRLRMFNLYGIKGEREIFFAEVILHAFDQLKTIAKHKKIEPGMAELQIDMSTRELRQMSSIMKTQKDTSDLLMLLKYVTEAESCKQQSLKMKAKGDLAMADEFAKMSNMFATKLAEALDYWEKARSLRPLYISNFGKKKAEAKK